MRPLSSRAPIRGGGVLGAPWRGNCLSVGGLGHPLGAETVVGDPKQTIEHAVGVGKVDAQADHQLGDDLLTFAQFEGCSPAGGSPSKRAVMLSVARA